MFEKIITHKVVSDGIRGFIYVMCLVASIVGHVEGSYRDLFYVPSCNFWRDRENPRKPQEN